MAVKQTAEPDERARRIEDLDRSIGELSGRLAELHVRKGEMNSAILTLGSGGGLAHDHDAHRKAHDNGQTIAEQIRIVDRALGDAEFARLLLEIIGPLARLVEEADSICASLTAAPIRTHAAAARAGQYPSIFATIRHAAEAARLIVPAAATE
jgi:hypothetical protein